MGRRYVSNANESVRMFQNPFLEFCSHVHPSVPLIIYLPAIGFFLYLAVWVREQPVLAVAALFALGVLFWTLLEYIIHRWAFHYEPKTGIGKKLHFIIHGVHHDYPNDATRLVMPPGVSIPLAFAFGGVFWLIFGGWYPAVFAGFGSGYLAYDMIHYATHHFAMRGWIGAQLKRYHLRHHYQDDQAGYGVSSPIWDYVFGTRQVGAKPDPTGTEPGSAAVES